MQVSTRMQSYFYVRAGTSGTQQAGGAVRSRCWGGLPREYATQEAVPALPLGPTCFLTLTGAGFQVCFCWLGLPDLGMGYICLPQRSLCSGWDPQNSKGISYKYTWWLPNSSQLYNLASIYSQKWRLVASYALQNEFVSLAFEISFKMSRVTPKAYMLLFLVISKDLLKKHALQTSKSQSLWPASAWDYERFGPNIVLVFKVVRIL